MFRNQKANASGIPHSGELSNQQIRRLFSLRLRQVDPILVEFRRPLGEPAPALGLFFRPASLAIMAVMIVATTNHLVSGQGTAAHAFKNAWLFAGFVLIGPGRYSLDQYFARSAVRRARSRA